MSRPPPSQGKGLQNKEVFQGSQTRWSLASSTASVCLAPSDTSLPIETTVKMEMKVIN